MKLLMLFLFLISTGLLAQKVNIIESFQDDSEAAQKALQAAEREKSAAYGTWQQKIESFRGSLGDIWTTVGKLNGPSELLAKLKNGDQLTNAQLQECRKLIHDQGVTYYNAVAQSLNQAKRSLDRSHPHYNEVAGDLDRQIAQINQQKDDLKSIDWWNRNKITSSDLKDKLEGMTTDSGHFAHSSLLVDTWTDKILGPAREQFDSEDKEYTELLDNMPKTSETNMLAILNSAFAQNARSAEDVVKLKADFVLQNLKDWENKTNLSIDQLKDMLKNNADFEQRMSDTPMGVYVNKQIAKALNSACDILNQCQQPQEGEAQVDIYKETFDFLNNSSRTKFKEGEQALPPEADPALQVVPGT